MQVGFNISNKVQFSSTKAKLNNSIKLSQPSDTVSFSSIDKKQKAKIGENFTDGIRIRMQASKEKQMADSVLQDAKNVQSKLEDIKAVSAEKVKKSIGAKSEADKVWKDYNSVLEQAKGKDFASFTDELTDNEVTCEKSDKETVIKETKDGKLVKETTIGSKYNQDMVSVKVIGDDNTPTKIYEFDDGVISSIATNPKDVIDEYSSKPKTSYDELVTFFNGDIGAIYENYTHTESYSEYSYQKGFNYSEGELFSYTEGLEHSTFVDKTAEKYILNEGQLTRYEKQDVSLLVKDGESTEVEYKYKDGELLEATKGYSKKYFDSWTFIDIESKYNFANGQVEKIVKGYGAFNNNEPCRQTEYIFNNGKLEEYNKVN